MAFRLAALDRPDVRSFANARSFIFSPVLQMALKAASIHLTSSCTIVRVSMPHHCASLRETSVSSQLISRQPGEDPCPSLSTIYGECSKWACHPQLTLSDWTQQPTKMKLVKTFVTPSIWLPRPGANGKPWGKLVASFALLAGIVAAYRMKVIPSLRS